jgi:hypothetical protein
LSSGLVVVVVLIEASASKNHNGVANASLSLNQFRFEKLQLKSNAPRFWAIQKLRVIEGQSIGVGRVLEFVKVGI